MESKIEISKAMKYNGTVWKIKIKRDKSKKMVTIELLNWFGTILGWVKDLPEEELKKMILEVIRVKQVIQPKEVLPSYQSTTELYGMIREHCLRSAIIRILFVGMLLSIHELTLQETTEIDVKFRVYEGESLIRISAEDYIEEICNIKSDAFLKSLVLED